jgi:hypothetical protein
MQGRNVFWLGKGGEGNMQTHALDKDQVTCVGYSMGIDRYAKVSAYQSKLRLASHSKRTGCRGKAWNR